jgi:hypothetical protein
MAYEVQLTDYFANGPREGWLALDEGGFLASFEDRRGGARPEGAVDYQDLTPAQLSREGLVRSGWVLDLEGYVGEDRHAGAGQRLLAFFGPQSSRTGELQALQGTATWGACALHEWRRRHNSGECLGCVGLSGWGNRPVPRAQDSVWIEVLSEEGLVSSRSLDLRYPDFGLYGYVHGSAVGMPAPYGRRFVPRRPLHVDQLPREVARSLREAPYMPVNFADAAWLQPVEISYCGLRGAPYLSSSGRCFRGA